MEMRKFGKTNLETSAVVFGGGFVGGIIIHADDDTRRKAIRMALDGRINWIDTAPIYGQGKSEEALGWLLEEVDEEPIISTKVYLDTNNLDDIPGQFKESIGKSLSRLRRDSVDVLHLHNPITNKGGGKFIGLHHILKSGGVLDALEEMVEKNFTKYIGITGLGDSKCCQEVIETGRIDSIQVYYNMINAIAAEGIPSYGGRCEGNMTSAADGFSRVTGEIAATSGTEGPGFTNMIMNIGAANSSRTPLLVIASNKTIGEDDTEPVSYTHLTLPTKA